MPNLLKSLFILVLISFGQIAEAQNDPRSDSIDIIRYTIDMDITDFAGKSIQGHCALVFQPKLANVFRISLDLLGLSVDSVLMDGVPVPFTYNDPLLGVNFGAPISGTKILNIYYQGVPVIDGGGSGWGGFYFQGSYAYNLGVGFQADPHNYGRVWFPCFDNFTERSTYGFSITTTADKKAFCNGNFISSINNPDTTITWVWSMDQSIPTYLASVAVGPYESVLMTHSGQLGNIPIVLNAAAADTANMRASFINLHSAITAFENAFGPHQFDRIGFNVVPFNGGAMEHATNIAYPSFAVNGGLASETLYAHELAHHWWGDLATCETKEDMWLNEGWASYAEAIFTEQVYGVEAYRDYVRDNHLDVLFSAHINDNGYRAISGIPHDVTYGDHVYNKGADVAHTLRAYLGDDFFLCISQFLEGRSFQSMNSIQFRDSLSTCSGKDLTAFFDNWVFAAGFPHFSIDSLRTEVSGSGYRTHIKLRQRLREAPAYYDNVPLTITFFDSNWQPHTHSFNVSGSCTWLDTWMPFDPLMTVVDFEERISDAITENYMFISDTGHYHFDEALFEMEVLSSSDSSFFRVEHNWVPPDRFKTPISGLHLSDNRYWRIDGIVAEGFNATARLEYDGRAAANFLDGSFITNSEDSMVLYYRKNAQREWAVVTDAIQNTVGPSTNKHGIFDIPNVKLGEYAMAIYDAARVDSVVTDMASGCDTVVGIYQMQQPTAMLLYPNPAATELFIDIQETVSQIEVFNLMGQLVYAQNEVETPRSIDISGLPEGLYILKAISVKGHAASSKFLILR